MGGADTLLGGDGNDVLSGGAGDDLLFGTSQDFAATPDLEADVLDGAEDLDQLFLGAQETGTGGEGADQFISRGGVTAITVTDYNAAEDSLIIHATPISVRDSSLTSCRGRNIGYHLNTGATIGLDGVTALVPADTFVIIDTTA